MYIIIMIIITIIFYVRANKIVFKSINIGEDLYNNKLAHKYWYNINI